MKLGDKVYAAGWDGSDYSSDINHASLASDIEYAKEVAYKATSFAVAPYLRYNAFKVGAVTFFADASAEIAALKVDGGDSFSGWSIGIKPGVSVDVTKKLTFVAHAGGIGYFDTEDINNRKGFEAELSTEDLTFSLLWNF